MIELPPVHPVITTPSGTTVDGFIAAGQEALDWSRRLRHHHLTTGWWPVLIDDDTPAYLANAYKHAAAPETDHTIDGEALLATRGEHRLQVYGTELAAKTRAELRGEGAWPAQAVRPGFRLPFDHAGGPVAVTVALVPAEAGWQVPAVLQYGGWNRYPTPAEHVAILRHWHDRYGAEIVAMTGRTAEFAVARPPRTRIEALALAWEYFLYNDGYYDLYHADNLTELAASLIGASVWLAWWD